MALVLNGDGPITGATSLGGASWNPTSVTTATANITGSINLSGGQIAFPATQVPSADANTLDDYEEGTWTPTIATGTFTARRPRYTKIGRMVTVSAYVDSFSDRSTAATVQIGGLPFAGNADIESVGSIFMRYSNNSVCAAYISATGTYITLYGVTTGDFSPLMHSQINNASAQIYFSVTYTST
jgi:hypothetical protein